MGNEIELYSASTALIKEVRGNYEIMASALGGKDITLKRDVHFMKIPKTKVPTLTKAGGEAICQAYGVFQRYEVTHREFVNNEKNPLFIYEVRCDLVKINPQDGKEWVVAQGFASANTGESNNGFAGAYNSLNKVLKMAQKRAMVCASINLAGASDWFTQDLDNDNFIDSANTLKDNLGDDDTITPKQIKRIFALARQAGYSQEEAKTKFKALGYASTKDIKQKEYDKVCALFEKPKEVAE